MKIGCVKVDVTPKMPVYLRGYGDRNKLSTGIEDKLEVGILILQQGKKRLLLLTVDIAGINMEDCARIYADLKAQTNFDGNNTFIYGSHTHFAPGFCDYFISEPGGKLEIGFHHPEKEYYDFWIKQVINGIKKADAQMEEVELEETMVNVSNLSFNRRPINKTTKLVETNFEWPLNSEIYIFQKYDPQFNIWRFKGKDGKIKAIIGRFSCHPVTGGENYYGVSADYPGYFQKYIKEYFDCPGLFIQGSAGDVVPLLRNGKSRDDIGRTLASAVRLAERTFKKVPNFTLDSKIVTVPVKLRVKCDRKHADELLENAIKKARTLNEPDTYCSRLAYEYTNIKMYKKDVFEVPLRFLRLGTKVLVGMPFEIFTSIGLGLREACPNAVLTSITGGYEGYMPLAKEYKIGGYEVLRGTRFNKTAGNNILSTAVNTVKNM